MAITIRNKETEAMIRRIGRRRGEGPSAVIARLAKQELQRAGEVSQAEFERRMKAWEELERDFPPPRPKPSWAEIEAEMQAMYDDPEEEGATR